MVRNGREEPRRRNGTRTPVTVIRGDGVGPEVIDAAMAVVDACGVGVAWDPAEAGASANIRMGDALPDDTIHSIRRNRICLKGPLEAPATSGLRSLSARLKEELDLYANIRPIRSYAGQPPPFRDVDLAIICENALGVYAGTERYLDHDGDVAESASTTTLAACQRIVRYAFDYATRNRRPSVTLVHNANMLKLSSGIFVQAGRDMAKHYGKIKFEEMIITDMAMQLVMDPSRFSVVVTSEALGDSLSAVATGLVGGRDATAAMNVGTHAAVFEPVHGIAMEIAGNGIANPTSAVLAGALLLRHIGETEAADRIEAAIRFVIADPKHVTAHSGGHMSTAEFADAVAGVVRGLESGAVSLR